MRARTSSSVAMRCAASADIGASAGARGPTAQPDASEPTATRDARTARMAPAARDARMQRGAGASAVSSRSGRGRTAPALRRLTMRMATKLAVPLLLALALVQAEVAAAGAPEMRGRVVAPDGAPVVSAMVTLRSIIIAALETGCRLGPVVAIIRARRAGVTGGYRPRSGDSLMVLKDGEAWLRVDLGVHTAYVPISQLED